MTQLQRNWAILAILTVLVRYIFADFEHLISKPESLTLARGYETLLTCEMNIEPDKFQWKFYPSDEPYNSRANLLLSNASYSLIPEGDFKINRRVAELAIKLKNEDVAGDYQCLAYYGASVIASVPWRITLARMENLPAQKNISISVQSGNTVSWRCQVPESNPPAYVDYSKGSSYVSPPNFIDNRASKSMILTNVSVGDSGTYKCATTNMFERKDLNAVLNLEVLRNGPYMAPSFVTKPLSEYTAIKGSTLFIECSAVGNPIPKVSWRKDPRLPSDRTQILPGGLIIKNITSRDDGLYKCEYSNPYGTINHQITVKYNEEPTIDCYMNMTDIKQGENMDIDCDVRGTPEPQIAWFLNGFSVLNDTGIEAIGNKIYFRPIEKRHAGSLQIFARNIVKTVYSSISIRVIPLASSIDDLPVPVHPHPRHNHKKSQNTRRPSKHKPQKMIPPSKPVISRVNDFTVVVRWNVSSNNGLEILFFKVQYREVSNCGSRNQTIANKIWNTANTDISATITAYEVSGLKPDHCYRFRIAAVYTNNDSKMSPKSKTFHLRSLDFFEKNPLPVCLITHVETVNHSAVKIYWECPPYNVTIDGFYILHLIATRAGDDYMINTVEGEDARSYVLNYLQPESIYDIKLQSFNQKLASEFSPIMKGRTGVNPVTSTSTTQRTMSSTKESTKESSNANNNVYIIIAGAVIGFGLVVTAIILLFVCRKWQREKLSDKQPNVEHHMHQAEDYVVEPKTIPRTNGCAGNRITITSNPLADTDKNPTVIEMRHLANNNAEAELEKNRPKRNVTVEDSDHGSTV
ncbi:unnamed protein product [Ceutorhynchus assimilis]|uniref:Interference hedgehog n=1 Tax=Ceutorhynchus assimilis TaxID=467358 RepID=A0A9N9MIH0_9CUCU|nr:unnamed protein product [Ceutorhynchus assimilis]